MIIIYKLPTMFLVLFRIGLPQCTLAFLHISALQNKSVCTAPLCSAYLGVQVVRILVEVPHPRVVGVGNLVALHPVFPPGVPPTLRHHTRDQRRRAHVDLQPLRLWTENRHVRIEQSSWPLTGMRRGKVTCHPMSVEDSGKAGKEGPVSSNVEDSESAERERYTCSVIHCLWKIA